MNTDAYLERIGLDRAQMPVSARSLAELQSSHLLHVPFENLDIHWKRPIVLDTSRFFEKIVGQRRGGFCYELNGAFNELLRALGFRTRLVSARVSDGNGGFGPEYDHLAIIVTIGEIEYLTDVGFGNFAASPLQIVPDIDQADEVGVFRMRRGDFGVIEVLSTAGSEWKVEYSFGLNGRDLREFSGMCEFHQTSPDSHFTRGKLCSILTKNGRKTLTDRAFVKTGRGGRIETPIASDDEFYRLLKAEFGISGPQSL